MRFLLNDGVVLKRNDFEELMSFPECFVLLQQEHKTANRDTIIYWFHIYSKKIASSRPVAITL